MPSIARKNCHLSIPHPIWHLQCPWAGCSHPTVERKRWALTVNSGFLSTVTKRWAGHQQCLSSRPPVHSEDAALNSYTMSYYLNMIWYVGGGGFSTRPSPSILPPYTSSPPHFPSFPSSFLPIFPILFFPLPPPYPSFPLPLSSSLPPPHLLSSPLPPPPLSFPGSPRM